MEIREGAPRRVEVQAWRPIHFHDQHPGQIQHWTVDLGGSPARNPRLEAGDGRGVPTEWRVDHGLRGVDGPGLNQEPVVGQVAKGFLKVFPDPARPAGAEFPDEDRLVPGSKVWASTADDHPGLFDTFWEHARSSESLAKPRFQ